MARRAKRRSKGATGILVAEGRLVATTVARTSLGVKVRDRFEVPIHDGDVGGALDELLEGEGLRGEVVCGLGSRRVFSIARPLGLDDGDRTPNEIVGQHLTAPEGGVVAAMQPVKLKSGPHVHLVATPAPMARDLFSRLAERRAFGQRFVPVPVALMHPARSKMKSPRGWQSCLRIFPGETNGLVVLCHKDRALAWREYDACDDGESLLVAIFGLRSHAQEELGLGRIAGMILHGGDERAAQAETLAEQFDLPCKSAGEVLLDDETRSFALACSGLRPQWEDLDLFSDLRPSGGFRQNFPSRVVPALGLVIGAVVAALYVEASSIEAEVAQIRSRTNTKAAQAGVQSADLKGLHDKYVKEMDLVDAFVVRRVFWEEYLKELPTLVPSTMRLNRFEGNDLVQFKKKSGNFAKVKQLALSGEVELKAGQGQPVEVGQLTDALQASELVQEQFPRITGTNVRLESGKNGALAKIAATCLPPKAAVPRGVGG